MLIAFCGSRRASVDLSHLVGPTIIAQAQVIWSTLKGPTLCFEAFYTRYPIPRAYFSDIQHRRIEPHRLLRFHNPAFEGDMSQIDSSTSADDADIDSPSSGFENETIFSDTQHWHSMRSILPSHLGGSQPKPVDKRSRLRMLRSNQRFISVLHVQAASLTGASGSTLQQIVIPPLGSRRASISASEANKV